jgi:hypothetical protein
VIVHGIDEFMDDLRRTWCGINLAPMDPRQADDAIVDCMTCLVRHASRRGATDVVGVVVSTNPDGTAVVEFATTGARPWR